MQQNTFSKAELERYSRHLIIPEFNIQGQKKLKSARVLVVGTGGLGAPLLQYLAAAGVGTIGILDFDIVDDSNLQRQVLFTTDDLGRPKVEAAYDRLRKLNPYIQYKLYNTRISSENALDIIREYDIVADGTDNFPTRYLVNDACVLLDKVNVYGSIFRFDGQVSVFNYLNKDGQRGPNYRDLFPQPPPPGLVPSCAEGGVIGVLPGIIGSLQVNEIIKVITGLGEPLCGKLFLFDAITFGTRTLKIKRRKDNPLNGENPTLHQLIDYEQFCGLNVNDKASAESEVKSISVSRLNAMLKGSEDLQLIDVREPYEYDIVNLGGQLIPKAEVMNKMEQIALDRPVIVMCRSGKRSADIIRQIESNFQYDNLFNLDGGILAWADKIDQSLPKY